MGHLCDGEIKSIHRSPETLGEKIHDAKILSEVKHSDHCPVLLELNE